MSARKPTAAPPEPPPAAHELVTPQPAIRPLLRVEDLSVTYGTIRALCGVTLEVYSGEIVALIGANGAGKSTTLRTISGLLRPAGGSIRLAGQRIDGTPVERIVRLGVSHVPEGRRIFPGLTVYQNLEVATAARSGPFNAELEQVFQLFPRLRERQRQLGWSLSGGEQQMLAIGRGLMARPRLLLLDEPSLGLAPLLVEELFSTIRTIRDQGATILLAEAHVSRALETADRAYILEHGRVRLEGKASELSRHREVKATYLGG